ncbi:unnamed protein product [Acanthoscelides obtectus]|uniref:Uncharacterized protein n=1 Tax=Acanthoscelides obtectus TaxID=200917 RepID=A0A9P0JMW8_ACAOB|nr:unnamed protein product [Acanthoscelides obtectus]CAK1662080.1 hypothetical protein AOBTE_LOCUS22969 [Acanthoscelides obtectus]
MLANYGVSKNPEPLRSWVCYKEGVRSRADLFAAGLVWFTIFD